MAKGDETPLKFALPSGETKNLTAGEFRRLPASIVRELAEYVVDGRLETHHDTLIALAGTAFTGANVVDLGRSGIGDNGQVWNTGAAFVKNEWHTTLEGEKGQFPARTTAIVINAELLAIQHPAKAATVGSGAALGMVTDSKDHATQPTGYNATAFLRALLVQSTWRWHWAETNMRDGGMLFDLPQTSGLSGFATSGNNNMVQNGMPGQEPRGLRRAKVITDEDDFWIRLRHWSALAVDVDFTYFLRLHTIETGERRDD